MHLTTRIRSAVGLGLASTFLLALAACGGGGAKPSSQRLSERATGSVAGAPQGYWEYLPPGYGDGAKRPLLVALHGSDENGAGTKASLHELLDTGIPKLIEGDDWPAARPFIVLMPQHSSAAVDACPTADEIDAFLRFAMKHYDVDPLRVYLTGLSCGAIGAWDYLAAAHRPRRGGRGADRGLRRRGGRARRVQAGRVPIWAFHGSADRVVDPTSGTIRPMHRLEKCTNPKPIDARMTIYDGVDHDSWDRTYDLSAGHDVYAWLLSHQHA